MEQTLCQVGLMSLWLPLWFNDPQKPFLSSFIYKHLIRYGTTLEPSGSNIRIIYVSKQGPLGAQGIPAGVHSIIGMMILLSNHVLYSGILCRSKRAIFRYNNVLGKMGA